MCHVVQPRSSSIVNMHSLTTNQSIRLLECIGLKGIRDAIIASGEEFDGDYLCGIDTEEDLKDFLSEVILEVSKLRLKAFLRSLNDTKMAKKLFLKVCYLQKIVLLLLLLRSRNGAES